MNPGDAMTAAPSSASTPALQLDPVVQLDDEGFFELCRRNQDLRLERRASGELELMAPVGGETSYRNADLVAQLVRWARTDGRGRVFDSSGGFRLPNGAVRSPDAAWVERDRLQELGPEDRQRFLPLCPSFVVELRSPSDPLPELLAKLEEYVRNGARLGWLLDPAERRVHVFRPGREPMVLDAPASVSGDPELRGLVLDLTEIWQPSW